MSVHVCVFLCDHQLPDREQWQAAIDDAGVDLKLDDCSPRQHVGFWPVHMEGKECGFEYAFDAAPESGDDLQQLFGLRDRMVELTWHSSQDDMRAAMLAAACLAKLVDGVFLDPQSGEFAVGAKAFELIKLQERAEQDRRRAQAERKWAHLTERRCPRCGAPCPEYRGRCAVCEFEIGKL